MSWRRYVALLLIAGTLCLSVFLLWNELSAPPPKITLEIRALTPGKSMPDGFFVLRNLNKRGIEFKCITLDNNVLLIGFYSDKQREVARQVLSHLLPEGYIIEQHGGSSADGNGNNSSSKE